jgi:tetratricopeptide (TPR) repeat protein
VDERDPSAIRNAVSGTVIGPSVQAGAIHGGVHVHAAPVARREIPRQLVASPGVFVGREPELAELDRFRRQGRQLIVLSGYGGVGKTFLARRWAHDVRESYPGGQLYIDLNGFSDFDPVDPGEALSLFLQAFGADPSTLPAGLPALAALYRSRTADQTMLVVLDNALSDAQVRVLLPASPTCLVVVTSRRQLTGLIPEGAAVLDVGPLSKADSVSLMSRIVGDARVAAEPAQAEELARLCDGLPLTLSVITARLARRPRLRLAQVAADLRAERNSLRAPRGTESVFDLSYRALDPGIGALYRRLSVNPGPEFGSGPVAALLAASTDSPPVDGGADDAIDLLLEASLVEEVGEDRFRMHDLLRLYAKQRMTAEETPEQRDRATRTVLEWYFAAARTADHAVTPYRRRLSYTPITDAPVVPSFADRDAGLDWLAAERVNLIAAGRIALERGWPELAWQFSDVMWPLLLYRKHYRDRRGIDEVGLEAAHGWGNVVAEAEMLNRLGRACTQGGAYAEAEQHLRRAAARFDELGDGRGRTNSEELLAALFRDSGRTAEALALFETVLAANRNLGDDRSTGKALINLGALLPVAGQPQRAIPLLREAQSIFARLTTADPYNGVRVEHALAVAHLAAGDSPQAEAAAERAATGMRRLGSQYEEAQAIEILARAARLRGDEEAAGRHRDTALRIYRSLDSPRAALLSNEADAPDTLGVKQDDEVS